MKNFDFISTLEVIGFEPESEGSQSLVLETKRGYSIVFEPHGEEFDLRLQDLSSNNRCTYSIGTPKSQEEFEELWARLPESADWLVLDGTNEELFEGDGERLRWLKERIIASFAGWSVKDQPLFENLSPNYPESLIERMFENEIALMYQ